VNDGTSHGSATGAPVKETTMPWTPADSELGLWDVDDIDLLDPDSAKAVEEIRQNGLKAAGEAAVDVADRKMSAAGGRRIVKSALKGLEIASARHLAFSARCGSPARPRTRGVAIARVSLLVAAGIAEAGLGFYGVRYARGEFGDIAHVWNDPVTMVIASVLGMFSAWLATHAGSSLRWGTATMLCDPEPAGRALTPAAAVGAAVQIPRRSSAAVVADPAATAESLKLDGSAADDVVRHAVARAFWTPLTKRMCGAAAVVTIVLALGMWTVNGIMRGAYNSRVHPVSGTRTGGILVEGEQSSSAKEPTTGGNTVEIIALSWAIFGLATMLVFFTTDPVRIRYEELTRELEVAEHDYQEAVARYRDPIRAHEVAEVAGQLAEASTRSQTAIVRSTRR
jgi:hypothetical protein